LIGLRFAADDEVVELAKQALNRIWTASRSRSASRAGAQTTGGSDHLRWGQSLAFRSHKVRGLPSLKTSRPGQPAFIVYSMWVTRSLERIDMKNCGQHYRSVC